MTSLQSSPTHPSPESEVDEAADAVQESESDGLPGRAVLLSRLRRIGAVSGVWLYAGVALAVALAAVLHRVLLGRPVFPVDDAYIVVHNAQVLHWGHDPNYVGVPALAGATSPIHLALVAALMFALPPTTALWAALWLATLAYALGLVRLARVHGLSQPQTLLLVMVGLAAGQTPHQLMNGLETGLALAALTWTLAFATDRRNGPSGIRHERSGQGEPATAPRPWRNWALPCLCGLLPAIRPDLAPVSLALLALQAGRHRRAAGSWRAAARPILADWGLALLCIAPWALWCLGTLGTPYPNSVEAKRLFFAQDLWPAVVKAHLLGQGFARFADDLGLLVLFSPFLARTGVGRVGLLFAATLAGAYFLEFPAAVSFYEGRYLYLLLPFLLLAATDALRPRVRQSWRRTAATALLGVCLLQSCWRAPDFWAQHLSYCGFTRHDLAGVAAWCRHSLPPDSTLLVHDAGYIAYATRFHLVDLVGLKTPGNIAAHRALTHPSAGRLRGAAVARIALASHTQYLVVLEGWENAFHLASGLRDQGWQVTPVETKYAYHVYSLRPPMQPPSRS